MNVLALDTATEACSVALLREDQSVFARFELAPRQHNQLLPMMLDQVLSDASIGREAIDYCAYTNGPGAFTGIRIGTAQAQGIGLGLGIPLVPLSTLAVMAQLCFEQTDHQTVVSTIDARMGEIYWGQYHRSQDNLAALLGAEQLAPVDQALPLENVDAIVGSGAGVLDLPATGHRQLKLYPDYLPKAEAMLKLAVQSISEHRVVAASAAPINYLRHQVAEKARST